MQCPACQQTESGNKMKSQVYDSRLLKGGCIIKRRRICPNCKVFFTTLEITIYRGKGTNEKRHLVTLLADYFSKITDLSHFKQVFTK